MCDADIRHLSGAQVLALESPDGEIDFNPHPEAIIRPRHTLIAVGSGDQVERLASLAHGWQLRTADRDADRPRGLVHRGC